jgi:hypothetical protein
VVTTFVNIEQIRGYLTPHAGRQDLNPEPTQIDAR